MARLKRVAICVLSLAFAGESLSACAANETQEKSLAVDFEGQIVWVVLKESIAIQNNPPSQVVKDASLREVGGRMFLVGTVEPHPNATDQAAPAGQVGVAWDCVQQYYVYTAKEYDALKKLWQVKGDD
jgi:hypothetical protein